MASRTSKSDGSHTWHVGRTSGRVMDDVDRRILAELTVDGRLSVRALAERVHISRANAHARFQRLRSDGVITGFTAEVDHELAGLGTSAYVMLSIQQNAWRTVAAAVVALPYVEHVALVGGDFDVLALVRAPNNAELRRVVLERIQEVPGVRATRTWLVFDERPGEGPTYVESVPDG